jgi:hypothetical protein
MFSQLPLAFAVEPTTYSHHPPPRETSATTDPRHQRIPQTMREAVKKRL